MPTKMPTKAPAKTSANTAANAPVKKSNPAAVKATNAAAVRNNTQKPTPPAKNTNAKAPGKNSKINAEFAQDMVKLDDVALISDILTTEKGLVKRYGTALTEVSCENLRKLITTHLTECACDQMDAFLYMNQRNLYPTEPAPANKVSQAKQKYGAIKNKMQK